MKPTKLPMWAIMGLGVGFCLQPIFHACAQVHDRPAGRVVAWGSNSVGQTTVPDGLTGVIAIAAGNSHNVALKQDGTVVAWGNNGAGQSTVPDGLSGVIAIAASAQECFALKDDDTIVAWGDSWGAGAVLDEAELKDAVAIAAGSWVILVLKRDGTVTRRVYRESTEMDVGFITAVPPGLTGVIAIANFGLNSLALKHDGTVVGWGSNQFGQVSVPVWLNGVVAIATSRHSMALRSDDTAEAWGENTYGQSNVPEDLGRVAAIAAGWTHSLAVKQDGTVVAWGDNGDEQCTVPIDLKGAVAVAGGRAHSLAIVVDPEPVLDVRLANGDLQLSWPMWATDYLLESSADPTSVVSWTVEHGVPVIVDSSFVVTTDFSGDGRFFRLRQRN